VEKTALQWLLNCDPWLLNGIIRRVESASLPAVESLSPPSHRCDRPPTAQTGYQAKLGGSVCASLVDGPYAAAASPAVPWPSGAASISPESPRLSAADLVQQFLTRLGRHGRRRRLSLWPLNGLWQLSLAGSEYPACRCHTLMGVSAFTLAVPLCSNSKWAEAKPISAWRQVRVPRVAPQGNGAPRDSHRARPPLSKLGCWVPWDSATSSSTEYCCSLLGCVAQWLVCLSCGRREPP